MATPRIMLVQDSRLDGTVSHNDSAPMKDSTSLTHSHPPKDDLGAQSSAVDPAAFPDGGTRAWLAVLGLFCAMWISFGWIFSVGVFQAYYELNQLSAYSHSEVAWIGSLEAFFLFAGGLWVGPTCDKRGPRGLIIGGTILHSFGLFMASLSTKYYQFLLAQGICSSFGTAMLFYPCVSCVISWFHARRSLAVAIAASGAGVGGIIMPVMVREMLIHSDVGFAWTMRTCAFIVLALGLIACAASTSRLPPTPKKSTKEDIVMSLKDKVFMLVLIAGPVTFLGMWVVFTFIVTAAIDRGVDTDWAFYLVPIMNAGSIPGRLVPGYLADKVGTITMFGVMTCLTFLSIVCVWLPVSGKGGLIVAAILLGFGTGGILGVTTPLIAQISDIKMIGMRTGFVFAFTGIGCLFGGPVGGAIISASGYRALQGFAGAFTGFSVLLVVYIRYLVGGFDFRKRV